MTLTEILTLVNEVADGDGKLKARDVNSACFQKTIILLRRGGTEEAEITFSNLMAELKENDTRLEITGKSDLAGSKNEATIDNETTITLIGEAEASRTCLIKVNVKEDCKLGDLAKGKLFAVPAEVLPADFDLNFKNISIEAASEKLELKVTGVANLDGLPNSVAILQKPDIKLTDFGFELNSIFIEQAQSLETRFALTGTLSFNGQNAKVAVRLPIRPEDGAFGTGQWTVSLDASAAPLGLPSLEELAGWVQVTDVFKEAPAEISGLGSFGLAGLSIVFDFAGGVVDTIEVSVATIRPWVFETGLETTISLEALTLTLEIRSPFSSTSRTILVRVKGRFKLGDVQFTAVMSYDAKTRDAVMSLSTGDEDAVFNPAEMSSLMGGFPLNTLGLPSGSLILDELTLDLNLGAPRGKKFRSAQLVFAVVFDPKWKLIQNVLSILEADFSLELRAATSPPTLRVNASLGGVLDFLDEFQVDFEMARIENRWMLRATAEEIELLAIAEKLGIAANLPQEIKNLTIQELAVQFASAPPEFSMRASIENDRALAGVPIKGLTLECHKGETTSMTVSASFQFERASLTLAFVYNGGWQVMIEAFGFRGIYDVPNRTVKISLGQLTVGQLIEKAYTLVQPGATIQFPEPWNQLTGISLAGVEIELDFTKHEFGVSYPFKPGEGDLGFTRLTKIGVTFKKDARQNRKKIMLEIETSNFPPLSLDPTDPNSKLPGNGTLPVEPFDLQFLALGQRLPPVDNAQPPANVSQALEQMKARFSESEPEKYLLAGIQKPAVDAQNGLLLGAEFSVGGLLSAILIYNDGAVAGVSIGLSGQRASFFRGFAFEILYKKVSEGLGVYQTELSLPESFRQLEFGAVSITIPKIAVEIYTNGKFRVDLGFPRNNDFSRSFQLQVFPYLGAGGFYFGLAEPTLTRRLPQVGANRGEFTPVLILGLGLSLGIGKRIERGILSAELSLTFEGIVEGTLAFFKGKQPVSDSFYYFMEGTLAIVIRIRGSVRFTVITAEVSLISYARVGVTLESYKPIVLSVSAGVSVNLVVRVGSGWLSANINCSFQTEIREQFTIPVRNPGIPAWEDQARPQVRSLRPATSARKALAPQALVTAFDQTPAVGVESLALAAAANRPIPVMTWDPIPLPNPVGELRLLFRPQFTMAEVNDQQVAHCVALLFLTSIGTATPEMDKDPALFDIDIDENKGKVSDVDRLSEAMLVWFIDSLLVNRGEVVATIDDAYNLFVSPDDLRDIYRVLTLRGNGGAPFTGAQVTAFLREYFNLVVEAQKRPEQGVDAQGSQFERGRPTVAVFPMIPELTVAARLTLQPGNNESTKYEVLHYSARFDKQTVVPPAYHQQINDYLKQMDSEFRTDVETDADRAEADPQPFEPVTAGGRSIAEYVFEDYFLLIARSVVQGSLEVINSLQPGENTVGNLIAKLHQSERFRKSRGLASRFMLPGLRLPRPNYLMSDERNLWRPLPLGPDGLLRFEPAPLYAMTGQQFALPAFPVLRRGDMGMMRNAMNVEPIVECAIDLIPPENPEAAERYVMAGVPHHSENEDVSKLTIELKNTDLDWIESIRQAPLIPDLLPPVNSLLKLELSLLEPRRFTLANRRELESPTLPFDGGNPVNAPITPTIWTLPAVFRSAVSEPRATLPWFSIEEATPGDGNQISGFAPRSRYLWATALPVKIRRIPAPDGEPLPTTYEIDGMDAEAILALDQILRRAESNLGFIKDVRILYDLRPPGEAPRLISEAASWSILRTNLSTHSSPPASASSSAATLALPNPESALRLEKLQTLWRASVVRSGGYYLIYSKADGSGLPSDLFDENGGAEITVLVIFALPSEPLENPTFKRYEVDRFVNRALIGEQTVAGSRLVATSQRWQTQVQINSQTRIDRLLADYRVSLDDLASALQKLRMAGKVALNYELLERDSNNPANFNTVPGVYVTTDGDRLGVLAPRFAVPVKTMVFRNAERIRFLDPEDGDSDDPSDPQSNTVLLTEGMFLRQPLLPQGHTGFTLRRKPPNPDPGPVGREGPSPTAQLNYLFSLLACRVAENRSFDGSVEVVADGPRGDGSVWQYVKLIPAFRFHRPVPNPQAMLLPDLARSPYRGIGETMAVRLDWVDGFGNKTVSPFHQPPQVDPRAAIFPLRLGYTDELIGVDRWPAVRAAYSFELADGETKLAVSLDFDVSRYTPLASGQRSIADAKRVARADLEVFKRIYYQLIRQGTTIRFRTTLDPTAESKPGETPVFGFGPVVIAYVEEIIRYLTKVSSNTYVFATVTGHIGQNIYDVIGLISPDDILRLNPDLPAILFDDILIDDTEIVLPNIGLPANLAGGSALRRPVSLSNTDPIFPLTVTLEIERPGRLVDDEFLDSAPVRIVAHELEPLLPGGEMGGGLRAFAETFEDVFAVADEDTGEKLTTAKLATGLARAQNAAGDSRKRIWVVRIGLEGAIQYEVEAAKQYFFAPIPLATSLLSAKDLTFYNFTGDAPTPEKATYVGVDLDDLARRFLNDLDTFLLPHCAVPAALIESRDYSAIIADKRSIAESIAKSIAIIARDGGGDIELARELLLDRMLIRLSAAYEIETVVQIGVAVSSPYDEADTAPRLFGQPVGELAEAADEDERDEDIDFVLSTAKLPLTNGQSYLTLLFDSKKVTPEQRLKLDLNFYATALEHEISSMPGAPGYNVSSWLTFVNSEEVIPELHLDIPIPIRVHPVPATLSRQSVERPEELDQPGQPIEKTRQYRYSFDYARTGSYEDLLYIAPRFKFQQSAQQQPTPGNQEVDLFQALASFDRVRERLQNDLLSALPVYEELGDQEKTRTKNALAEFARLTRAIAAAWPLWHDRRQPSQPSHRERYEKIEDFDQSEDHLYMVREKENEDDGHWEIIVRKCKPAGKAPIPVIKIGDWKLSVETEPDQKRIQFYKGEEESATFMTREDAMKIAVRTALFEELDILHKQNVWAGVRTTRNETLFPPLSCETLTNRKFVYRTPLVRFAEILTPLLEYDHKIDIAQLPEEAGGEGDETTEKSLEEHLVRLFKRFFESVAEGLAQTRVAKRRIQLTCRYQYDLDHPPYGLVENCDAAAEGADSLLVTLPIVMAPPIDFKVRKDYASCEENPSSFVCALSQAIKIWFSGDAEPPRGRYPSRNNGRFNFDISVYSTLCESELPIYRLKDLRLMLNDVSDLKEGDED